MDEDKIRKVRKENDIFIKVLGSIRQRHGERSQLYGLVMSKKTKQ